MSYALLFTPQGRGIQCLECSRVSFNQNDIDNLYCGFCTKFHEEPAGARNPLPMWTVYDHPSDWPYWFVARKHLVDASGSRPTSDMFMTRTLEELRGRLGRLGLTPIQRDPSDDPVIVEVWL